MHVFLLYMAKKENSGLSCHRIEALTDGIFAFAMTILVLSINIPLSSSSLEGKSVADTLLMQADKLVNYGMSFLLLAIFWLSHHRVFDHLKFVDSKLIWGNVFLLMFIALMPFSTELANEFPRDSVSDFLFAFNLFIIGLIYYLLWSYATKGRRLVKPSLDQDQINRTKKSLIAICAISVLAMILAFVHPIFSSMVYLLIPIVLWMTKSKNK